MGFASKLNMNFLSKGDSADDSTPASGEAQAAQTGSAGAAVRRLGSLGADLDAAAGDDAHDLRASPFGAQQPNRQRAMFAAFGVGLLVTLLAMWQHTVVESRKAGLGQIAGDSVMHSQRIGKAAPNALRGDAPSFIQLEESRAELSRELNVLARGGESPTGWVPPASGERAEKINEAIILWNQSAKAAGTIISFKTNLLAFGVSLRQFEEVSPELLGIADKLQKDESSDNRREVAALSMMSLTQRLYAGTQTFTTPNSVQNAVVTILADIESLDAIIDGLLNGSTKLGLTPMTDLEQRMRLERTREGFRQYAATVTPLLGDLTSYARARAAERVISRDNELLREMLTRIHQAYRKEQAQTGAWLWITVAAGVFTLLAAVAISRSMLDESRERTFAADERRREADAMRQLAQSKEEEAKATNEQNQAAILRLMNELQEVADGDLTVHATVSEDITGAIADSVNYTVEELRELVVRVIRTSEQVARASGSAQQVSGELLSAAEQQSREIQDASTTTLRLSGLINEVSRSASESADVARQSVAAAEQGATAVQNAIEGMQEIREQIQETSKRIKRLGESSQEIGEITELISDITEQTNVLALNAAIQAASAGEAGRGFSVVAEEVQRLAERSGDAAKQIGALVRTIQTDTHDAVAAMEKSTQGVVEGARLSDAAGTALADISRVSNRLGELIQDMSTATERQAEKAIGVAEKMQQILSVTEHAQQGTRQTAQSIHELTTLAQELKDSVSRFRVVS